MKITPAVQHHITVVEDSRRWGRVELRPDDIIISTPSKSGSTWIQGIVMALQWPADDAPDTLHNLSQWPEFRLVPVDDMAEQVEAGNLGWLGRRLRGVV